MELDRLRDAVRVQRGVEPAALLAAKVGRIGRWFRSEGLDAAVVGLSGGVDSAVVLALLQRVRAEPGTSLRRVVALVAPIDALGATGQAVARARAVAVADALEAERWVAPAAAVQDAALGVLKAASGLEVGGWAAGQVLSIVRTPLLYGAAALLQQEGHRSVVVGTTNRDEGAYLGFFGKASDGTVDVQPISDLHKSEVSALAVHLGIPRSVREAPPSGDVWDGRTDAEMIGLGYDDVELVLRLRELGFDPDVVAGSLPSDDGSDVRLKEIATVVEDRHGRNAHKYRVDGPAVHLDVLPRAVPGGWRAPDTARHLHGRGDPPPPAGSVPAPWRPGPIAIAPPRTPRFGTSPRSGVRIVPNAVDRPTVDALVREFAAAPHAPVGVSGRTGDESVGSHRGTAWSPELADGLWPCLRCAVPSVRFLDEHSHTDGWADGSRTGHRTWRAVGLSPLLRFMRYDAGGHHRTHFDAGYDYGDGRRTLQSFVLFLTGAGAHDGGALRFIDAGHDHLPVWARDHEDWDRDTRPEEVLLAVPPVAGTVVVFDHRLGHDVERWRGAEPRVVVRGDVVFEAVDDGRRLP